MKAHTPLTLAVFFLTACSSATAPTPTEAGPAIGRIELFMSRASLVQVDFEQFVLRGSTLFHECGRVNQGRQFPAAHGVVTLDNATISELSTLATDARAGEQKLAPAGNNKNLADPGVFTLALELDGARRTVRTNVDAVANAETAESRRLRALAVALRRASGGKLCDYQSFYGVG